MNKLHFGTAGIPLSTPGTATTLEAFPHLNTLGLDAMELEFVRSVHVKKEKAPLVKQAAQKHNIVLTCHGQYWINMNAKDSAIIKASISRAIEAATRAYECGAWSTCFHMAYYMGNTPEQAYEKIKKNVKEVMNHLKNNDIGIWVRPETGGKLTQFADIDQLIKLSQDVDQVLPCIDWAHHCARTNGKVNNHEEFTKILEKIEKGLGREALDNMHMHIEGIEWNEKGERNHLTFNESAFNYKDALKACKDFKVKGVIISESPNIEEDARIAKNYYEER